MAPALLLIFCQMLHQHPSMPRQPSRAGGIAWANPVCEASPYLRTDRLSFWTVRVPELPVYVL